MRRRRRLQPRLAVATVAVFVLGAACRGPSLTVIANGPRFVDGQRLDRSTVTFRYYGTAVVDALPSDVAESGAETGTEGGRADWSLVPKRTAVPLPPPAPTWLFPFDLPLELLGWTFGGNGDRSVEVTPAPAATAVVSGFQPDLQPVRDRAFAARASR